MKKSIIALFCVTGFSLLAQKPQIKMVGMAEAVDFTLKNNENIKTGNLEIDYHRQFKKGATEIPKTNVLFAQGQFNSLYKYDNSVTVGYWNLSLFGLADFGRGPYTLTTKDRLQGVLVGINIPLWFYPQASRAKAADIKTKVAQSDYNYNKTVFEGQFKQSYTLYLKYQNSIGFYKKSALVKSQVIIEQALKSYETKKISYVDYLTVVSNALDIESHYLNVINQNNLTVLKLEYLMTK